MEIKINGETKQIFSGFEIIKTGYEKSDIYGYSIKSTTYYVIDHKNSFGENEYVDIISFLNSNKGE